ncbi:hypothetical protein GCM10007886_19770 [Methylobacterium gregans]|nr:hypothetical protein GCM10007886_19770 [Methylobacterium gregans]
MRLKVSRARSGRHGSGVGSDGTVRTSSLARSRETQWAGRLQACRRRGEQEPRIRRMAHKLDRGLTRSGTRAGPALVASFTPPGKDKGGPGNRPRATAFLRA